MSNQNWLLYKFSLYPYKNYIFDENSRICYILINFKTGVRKSEKMFTSLMCRYMCCCKGGIAMCPG